MLICPISHALAQHDHINLLDTLNFSFIGLMPHHSLQQSIDTQAKLLGFDINIVYDSPTFLRLLRWSPKASGLPSCLHVLHSAYMQIIIFIRCNYSVHGQIVNCFWQHRISSNFHYVINNLQIFIATSPLEIAQCKNI